MIQELLGIVLGLTAVLNSILVYILCRYFKLFWKYRLEEQKDLATEISVLVTKNLTGDKNEEEKND